MIKLYINGELRDDILIQAGGALEQTEEHTTESNISIQVPIVSDDLQVYDYVQIFDEDTIIFAGNILSLNQQMLDSGYTELDFRIYDLVMACNADLVANVLVDMSFPQGATITQILKGNHKGDTWYNENLGEFAGVIDTRIVPEGCTVGKVADYNTTVLESMAYVWGETVKTLLDNLAELTLSYWEITDEKVFNFQPKAVAKNAPFNMTQESEIFDINVESDSLATYSAVRVIGGDGELAPRYFNYPSEEFYKTDDKTLTSVYKLASVEKVSVAGASDWVKVGFNGIHDDDDNYPVLMSYGGDTLEIKDSFPYTFSTSNGDIYGAVVINKITARAISVEAQNRIKKKRGGTGIIEYVLEDETICNYNDASLNANSFLDRHKNNVQTVKFSTFAKGFSTGQKITGNIPYYKISGDYYIGAVNINFILDSEEGIIAQYDIECTSSVYRDAYKTLFYTPQTLSFEIGESTGNINGFSYEVEIDIVITVKTQVSNIPTWEEVTGDLWSKIDGVTWTEFYNFTEGVTFMGRYATEAVRAAFAKFAQGDFLDSATADEVRTAAWSLMMDNHLIVNSEKGDYAFTQPQSTTPVTGTEFTSTYYFSEKEAKFMISQMLIAGYTLGEPNVAEIPVSIDKSPTNPQGEYAMTIGITVDFQ